MSLDFVPSGFAAAELAERCYDDIHCLRIDLETVPQIAESHKSALDDVLAFFNDCLS
jgi:hypothetical protein